MKVNILTIFPDIFIPFFTTGIVGKAVKENYLEYNLVNLRDYSGDSYGTVDDYPYGGGPGMIMKVEPVVKALESLNRPGKKYLLSPRGKVFNQDKAGEIAGMGDITFVCGRYKGVDERIRNYIDEEISIGDYILSGGELPSMVVIEAAVRLIDGVVGDPESVKTDSFEGELLDSPRYTRPRKFRGEEVPSVLLSGDHGEIEKWREKEARRITEKYREDLIKSKGDKDG